MKTLVAFFSASGTTAKLAKTFAEKIGADIFEIVPEKPYSKSDLIWLNPLARCNREKFGKKEVPVSNKISNFEEYEKIFLGFPIWYGSAPNIINTFCKAYDWSNKKIYAFATSITSGIGKTAEKLKPYVNGASFVEAKLIKTPEELETFSKEN